VGNREPNFSTDIFIGGRRRRRRRRRRRKRRRKETLGESSGPAMEII